MTWGCYPGCYYYGDSCFRKDCMNSNNVTPLKVPAHKQTDPSKVPGQIVNTIPESTLYKPAHGGYPTPTKDKQ
jgi:hypothetical protein